MGPVRWGPRGEKPDLPDPRVAHGPWDSASLHFGAVQSLLCIVGLGKGRPRFGIGGEYGVGHGALYLLHLLVFHFILGIRGGGHRRP